MERGRGAHFAVLLLAAALAVGISAHGHMAPGGAAALHAAESGAHALSDCARCAGGSIVRSAPAALVLRAPDCGAAPGRARLAPAPRRPALARAAAPRAPPVTG